MNNRKYFIQLVFILVGSIFLIKLFFIQVLDENYKLAAQDNVMRPIIEYPYRGVIYDRNGSLIVHNTPVYDIMVVPKEVEVTDTLALCNLLNIDKNDFIQKIEEARDFSFVQPSVFLKQVPNHEFAKIQDQLTNYRGFTIVARTIRNYPNQSLANALGYMREIDKTGLEKDSAKYYKQGDYIGIKGIEEYYENYLRGKRGVKFKMVNVSGLVKGSFKSGQWDTLSIPGQDLISTIDLPLQQYGEKLMEGKSGSIVAIEPSTGEILSLVSAPSYDPNTLAGREFSTNFKLLSNDTLAPLFNRPLMAQYRPGSIFKIIQAMIALQEGVITPNTRIPCDRSIIGCHGDHYYENLQGAITHSCNPYFHNVLRRVVNQKVDPDVYNDTKIGLDKWREHVASFGLGASLGVDLPNEKEGLIPNSAYYDKAYRNRPWKYSNIYSIAIGEGENLVVPIQMANFAAIVANRGFYYIPHLIKSIGEDNEPLQKYREKKYTTVDPEHFNVAVEAMAQVVRSGTGQYRAKLANIEVCGKTGTVQNDPLPDHSVFIAFAPKDDPKIAVSVYVEDAGQGARAAASIASLMIEKYLIGHTERPHIEDYVLRGKFLY
ncbi:penicillin-binding protein 2 [Fulvivirgaceae bacterium BMA10]|uniref:Penicillin-binding protein 2 n=1 Tax=Splendidivirga corallicola TaxID=3051826 RepID=A0ABT8KU43_9BACT|nr:penicillin-binding protein 2 [Fulvivirgaceae bacterium BMA10]